MEIRGQMVNASDENSEIFFESIYLCKIKLCFLIPIFTMFDDFVVVVVAAVAVFLFCFLFVWLDGFVLF